MRELIQKIRNLEEDKQLSFQDITDLNYIISAYWASKYQATLASNKNPPNPKTPNAITK